MSTTATRVSNVTEQPVTREYEIRGTKYIVRASVRDGANEDAITKIRRLIRNEMKDMSRKVED